jgi:hypothetical protein
MSQSRTICPHCERWPGRQHSDSCPRGTLVRQELRTSLQLPSSHIWPGKGPVHASVPQYGDDGRQSGMRNVSTFNPGVPMVKPGKPWTAGGIPRGRIFIGFDDDRNRVFGDRKELARTFYRDFVGPIRGGA